MKPQLKLVSVLACCGLWLGLLTSAMAGASVPADLSVSDRTILAAYQSFAKRDAMALASARSRVKDHVLAPYVDYWWLNASLTHSASFALTNSDDIRTFLNTYPDTPLSDMLRRDWLKLAGRQHAWPLFVGELTNLNQDDIEITCLSWQQRWQQQTDRSILSEARSFWKEGKPAPDACYAVFDILADEKLLDADEVWPRVRILLDNNQPADMKKSAAYLGSGSKTLEAAANSINSINSNALRYLQREHLQPQSAQSVELFLYAISRLARSDAAKAAEWMQQHGAVFAEKDAGYAWAQIALSGAMQHEDQAPIWFLQAGNYPMNDTQLGWKVRAALRLGDWPQVQRAIEAMSATEKRDPAWRYWLARSLAAQQKHDPATALFEVLATENHFYGLLAAEELRITRATAWDGWKPGAADRAALAKHSGIRRALALYQLDMKNDGLREWQFAIRNMDDKQLLTAAALASEANIPDRAIITAERTLVLQDFGLRYPTPYRDELSAHSTQFALDEPWVYGLIRQESRFIASVQSRVGASGLMQLMPATAKSVAKKLNIKNFSWSKIADVKTNIQLGTAYLRSIFDSLGDKVLATAGYNAGPGRAKRWQADFPLEAAIYIESIPFAETRDYVKKVMANQWFYTQRLGLATIGLKKYLGTVPAKNTNPNTNTVAIAAAGAVTGPGAINSDAPIKAEK